MDMHGYGQGGQAFRHPMGDMPRLLMGTATRKAEADHGETANRLWSGKGLAHAAILTPSR